MTGTVKTRKKHECRVCGEKMPPGETAIRRAGFGIDGPWTIHMHPECEPLTKDWNSMDWETIGPGEVKRPTPADLFCVGLPDTQGGMCWLAGYESDPTRSQKL